MQVKMLIIFDYDPETNEYTPISQEVIEEGKKLGKTSKAAIKDDGSTEAQVILEDNKIVLNSKAVELLGAKWEDRISVRYEKQGDRLVPVIGKDEMFNCSSGNKLTKSKTIACRGKANNELSKHGNTFKMVSIREGIFMLDGGIVVPVIEEAPKMKRRTDINVKVDEDAKDLPAEAILDADGDTEITEEFTFEL